MTPAEPTMSATETTDPTNHGTTYALRLVFDHDQGSYLAVRRVVRDAIAEGRVQARTVWPDEERERFGSEEVDRFRDRHAEGWVAQALREFVEDVADVYLPHDDDSTGALIVRTLVTAGLSDADWHAWARSLVEDVAEEDGS